ncbi:uncharacterized protein LOC144124764 isoform X2 [Amblyomma americanum]
MSMALPNVYNFLSGRVHHECSSVVRIPGSNNGGFVPSAGVSLSLEHQDDASSAPEKAGHKLEALGRVLQGKVSEDGAEAEKQVAEALEALAAAEGTLDEESSEYWVGVVVRGVIGGAIAHGIDKWKGRKG